MKRKKVEINIPEITPDDIKDIDDEEEDDEEYEVEDEEEERDTKISRQIEIITPYISISVTTECKDDDLKLVTKTAEKLMKKYKNHHLDTRSYGDYE